MSPKMAAQRSFARYGLYTCVVALASCNIIGWVVTYLGQGYLRRKLPVY